MASKLETLTDRFEGAALRTALWTQFTGGSATFTYDITGAAVVYPVSTTSTTDGDITTVASYDLTASYAFLNVTSVPNVGAPTNTDARFLVGTTTNGLAFLVENGSIFAQKFVASAQTNITSTAYSATTHAWWRIREGAGTTFWETSSDGLAWTTFTSQANPITVTSLTVQLAGTAFGSSSSPGNFKFRSFNIPPSFPQIRTFLPGYTWIRRFGWVERNRTPIWYNQGIDDIPQQMNMSTFRPGPAWVQRFGKNERRIFLPAISGFVAWLQNLADSVASSDGVVNNPTLNKSDTVTSSDSPAKNVTLNKSDTATSSDSISNRPTLNKADSVTSSDTIVKNVSKALADSVTSSESISKTPTKNLADSVSSSDTITTKAVVKNLADSVTLVETLLLVDGNLSEVVGPPNAFTFHINDSTTSSDLISTTTVYKRSLADTATAAEAISNQPTKNLADAVTSSESIAKIPTLNKVDSVSTADATVRAVVLNKTDTATSTDSISNQPTKQLSDSAVVSDSLLKSLVKSLADSVTSSDALAKAVGLNKADSVSVAEAISNRFTKHLTDTVVSSDLSLRYLNGVLVTGSTSTLTNTVITTNGEIVLRLAGQEQQFIRLLDGRWALRVGKKLYMVL